MYLFSPKAFHVRHHLPNFHVCGNEAVHKRPILFSKPTVGPTFRCVRFSVGGKKMHTFCGFRYAIYSSFV